MAKNTLDLIALILVIVGAVNWGLVGIANWNLVSLLLGSGWLARIVYMFVGIAGLWTIKVASE